MKVFDVDLITLHGQFFFFPGQAFLALDFVEQFGGARGATESMHRAKLCGVVGAGLKAKDGSFDSHRSHRAGASEKSGSKVEKETVTRMLHLTGVELSRLKAFHQVPVVRYSWIDLAARRPAPIARITVALPSRCLRQRIRPGAMCAGCCIGFDIAALVGLQAGCGALHYRVRAGANGHHRD